MGVIVICHSLSIIPLVTLPWLLLSTPSGAGEGGQESRSGWVHSITGLSWRLREAQCGARSPPGRLQWMCMLPYFRLTGEEFLRSSSLLCSEALSKLWCWLLSALPSPQKTICDTSKCCPFFKFPIWTTSGSKFHWHTFGDDVHRSPWGSPSPRGNAGGSGPGPTLMISDGVSLALMGALPFHQD